MEPFSLAVLGGVAAAEGVKFLYGQASDLLKEWRAHRALNVPPAESDALDGPVPSTTVDPELLRTHHRELTALSAGLSPYALDHADLDLDDPEIAATVDQLRRLLEILYGVRLTFRGEQRERTGTTIDVQQRLETVHGSATGLAAKSLADGAEATIRQAGSAKALSTPASRVRRSVRKQGARWRASRFTDATSCIVATNTVDPLVNEGRIAVPSVRHQSAQLSGCPVSVEDAVDPADCGQQVPQMLRIGDRKAEAAHHHSVGGGGDGSGEDVDLLVEEDPRGVDKQPAPIEGLHLDGDQEA